MQPFLIRLAYRGRHWLSVTFELCRDEVGSTTEAETTIADDLVELFATLGLGAPAPVALLSVEHQIVQKLHACTSQGRVAGGNDRAHDLVDLQILIQEETINLAKVDILGQRLFAARRTHPWPLVVVEYASWDTIYREAADGPTCSTTSPPRWHGPTTSSAIPAHSDYGRPPDTQANDIVFCNHPILSARIRRTVTR